MGEPFATHNRRAARGQGSPELPIRSWKGGGRVRGMLAAPLEESASTARPLRVRDRLGIGSRRSLRCGHRRLRRRRAPGRGRARWATSRSRSSAPSFPSKQQLAQNTNLTLSVANTGDKTIPDLAITIFTDLEREHERHPRLRPPGHERLDGHRRAKELPAGAGLILGPLRPARPRDPLPAGLDPRAGLSRSSPARPASAGAEAAQTDTFSFGALGCRRDQRDGLERDAGAGRAPTLSTTASPPACRARRRR